MEMESELETLLQMSKVVVVVVFLLSLVAQLTYYQYCQHVSHPQVRLRPIRNEVEEINAGNSPGEEGALSGKQEVGLKVENEKAEIMSRNRLAADSIALKSRLQTGQVVQIRNAMLSSLYETRQKKKANKPRPSPDLSKETISGAMKYDVVPVWNEIILANYLDSRISQKSKPKPEVPNTLKVENENAGSMSGNPLSLDLALKSKQTNRVLPIRKDEKTQTKEVNKPTPSAPSPEEPIKGSSHQKYVIPVWNENKYEPIFLDLTRLSQKRKRDEVSTILKYRYPQVTSEVRPIIRNENEKTIGSNLSPTFIGKETSRKQEVGLKVENALKSKHTSLVLPIRNELEENQLPSLDATSQKKEANKPKTLPDLPVQERVGSSSNQKYVIPLISNEQKSEPTYLDLTTSQNNEKQHEVPDRINFKICSNCREVGHTSGECYYLCYKSYKMLQKATNVGLTNRNGRPRCFNCRGRGHVHRDCKAVRNVTNHADLIAKPPCVRIKINGESLIANLDTGSRCSFISDAAVRRMLLPCGPDFLNEGLYVPRGCVWAEITVGADARKMSFAVSTSISYDLVLGCDWMAITKAVIDTHTMELVLNLSNGIVTVPFCSADYQDQATSVMRLHQYNSDLPAPLYVKVPVLYPIPIPLPIPSNLDAPVQPVHDNKGVHHPSCTFCNIKLRTVSA